MNAKVQTLPANAVLYDGQVWSIEIVDIMSRHELHSLAELYIDGVRCARSEWWPRDLGDGEFAGWDGDPDAVQHIEADSPLERELRRCGQAAYMVREFDPDRRWPAMHAW